jgi:peroxiredoxin
VGALGSGRTLIYCYPRTGVPGEDLPDGWDAIPGARGCTPQACAFRDHQGDLASLDASVFGLSTQDTAYQRELADRLHLPFEILSDAQFRLTNALRLPTFEVDGMRLIRRLTLVVRGGTIEHVFYPVYPPDAHADEVLRWLERQA